MDKVLERIVECIGPRHGAKKDLADHLGIHPNVITNWLSGRNKSYNKYISEIADYFGVSAHYLKTGEKEKPATKSDELTYDDFTYALYNEAGKLTEENKAKLLEMAKFFQMQQEKEKSND